MKLYHQYLLKSAFIPSKNRFIRDFFDRLFGQPHQKGVNKKPAILLKSNVIPSVSRGISSEKAHIVHQRQE